MRSSPAAPSRGSIRGRFGLARVANRSMLPVLRDGDRLLVDYGRRPRAGDVVIARLPTGVMVVKRAVGPRATAGGAPGWWLLSDNAEEGAGDSRAYGAIADSAVVAVVRARLWRLPPRVRM